jgi:hypothetical protein
MNEHLYSRLRHEGLKCFELPTQHVNLLSAFNKKSNRVKKQAMLDVSIGDFKINQIILLSPQLLTDAILGLDFLVDHHAVINFAEWSITLKVNDECIKIGFIGIKETTNKLGNKEESSTKNQIRSSGLVQNFPRKLLSLTADPGQHPTDPTVTTVNEEALVKNEKGGTSVSEKNKQQLVEDEGNILIPQRVSDRDEYVEFAPRYDETCRSLDGNNLSTLVNDKEGHIVDDCGATEHEINEECRKSKNVAANKRTLLCFTTTGSKTDAVNTQQGLDTGQIMTDDRMITAEQLRGKVSENNNLSPQQQEDVCNALIKYQQHLTKRPGKCTKFEYEFKIEGSIPTSANSRLLPFSLRDQVCDQIQVMLKDDILEESFSSYVNPLTLDVREMKPLHICVDA